MCLLLCWVSHYIPNFFNNWKTRISESNVNLLDKCIYFKLEWVENYDTKLHTHTWFMLLPTIQIVYVSAYKKACFSSFVTKNWCLPKNRERNRKKSGKKKKKKKKKTRVKSKVAADGSLCVYLQDCHHNSVFITWKQNQTSFPSIGPIIFELWVIKTKLWVIET